MAIEPIDLHVDTEALRDLGRELQSLMAALSGEPCRAAVDADAMGGDDIAQAVDRFAARWSDGRSHMIENLRQCTALVQHAIDKYEDNETFLQATVGPTGLDGYGVTRR